MFGGCQVVVRRGPFGRYCQLEGEEGGEERTKKKKKKKVKDVNVGFPDGVRWNGGRGWEGERGREGE